MTAKAQNTAPSRAQRARDALVDAALPNAAFDGWSETTLTRAARLRTSLRRATSG